MKPAAEDPLQCSLYLLIAAGFIPFQLPDCNRIIPIVCTQVMRDGSNAANTAPVVLHRLELIQFIGEYLVYVHGRSLNAQ